MTNLDNSKHNDIIEAAFTQFIQYGFQKTTMADIAVATGISRPSIYTYFENKEEIFKATSIWTNDLSHEKVKKILDNDHEDWKISKKIEAALFEHYGRLLEITRSPHGSEIYDEHNRLCGEIAQQNTKKLRNLLTQALIKADKNGEINFASISSSAQSSAEILQMSAVGLKSELPPVKTFKKRISAFVEIFFAGLENPTDDKPALAKAV